VRRFLAGTGRAASHTCSRWASPTLPALQLTAVVLVTPSLLARGGTCRSATRGIAQTFERAHHLNRCEVSPIADLGK
jgi:hypothetical protein